MLRRCRQGGQPSLSPCLPLLLAALCASGLVVPGEAAGRGADVGHAVQAGADAEEGGPPLLTLTTFNRSMAESEAPFSLCEFFASWCPACMNFKPQYKRVATLFNAAPAGGAFVYVAAVDCATETALCQHFKVDRYPTMLWGEPASFAANLQRGQDPRAGLEPVETARSAEAIVEWINAKTKQSFSLTSSAEENSAVAVQARAVAQQERSQRDQPALPAELWDMEEATALAFKYMLAAVTLDTAAHVRPNISSFTHLLAEHHPSFRCQAGAASLVAQLDSVWPVAPEAGLEGVWEAPELQLEQLQQIAVCGAGIPRAEKGTWRSCAGSTPDTRGYSCGLWQLFHSLSVRLDAWEGWSFLAALRGFVDVGFQCKECRRHFLEASRQQDAAAVHTRRDAVLWLWGMHNSVNERLARSEAESKGGDPAFPKSLWPTRSACPECRKNPQSEDAKGGAAVRWDEDAVYRFLTLHYRQPVGDNPREGQRERIGFFTQALPRDKALGGASQVGGWLGALLVFGGVGSAGWWWQGRRRRRKAPLFVYPRLSKE